MHCSVRVHGLRGKNGSGFLRVDVGETVYSYFAPELTSGAGEPKRICRIKCLVLSFLLIFALQYSKRRSLSINRQIGLSSSHSSHQRPRETKEKKKRSRESKEEIGRRPIFRR